MSALSATQLRLLLKEPDPQKRLVVSPILDPESQLKGNQAALDVRLGRVFSLVRAWTQGVAEAMDTAGATAEPHPPLDSYVLEFGQPLILHPHQFVLARTLEILRLPQTVMAYVVGRSSWGRRGLTVATAVVVHPGFAGPITLEIKNVGEVPIALYPFDRVAQLTFHDVQAATDAPREKSQFAATFVPTLGRVRDDATETRIRSMAVRRRRSIKAPEPVADEATSDTLVKS
jgi:dCTP deaminase